MVREGIRCLLKEEGYHVVADASDGRDAVRLAKELHPDMAILELAMPHLNGIDAGREIALVSPGTRTLILTAHFEDQYVLEALRAGIKGYLLKTRGVVDLIQAIHEVSKGMIYLSPGVSRALVDACIAKSELPPDPLTPRQRQLLQLVADGKTTKEAAAILQISVKTAESHRTRIMDKLGIHETAGLVRYAIRQGLVQP